MTATDDLIERLLLMADMTTFGNDLRDISEAAAELTRLQERVAELELQVKMIPLPEVREDESLIRLNEELRERVAELEAENARLKEDVYGTLLDATRLRAQRAEAERDALRADAERYRTARLMRLRIDNSSIAPHRPDKFDAMIDAARKEKPCDCVRPEIHGHQLLCKQGKAR